VLHAWNNFRRDAAADKDASGGEEIKAQFPVSDP
jgi:hypothetical protein